MTTNCAQTLELCTKSSDKTVHSHGEYWRTVDNFRGSFTKPVGKPVRMSLWICHRSNTVCCKMKHYIICVYSKNSVHARIAPKSASNGFFFLKGWGTYSFFKIQRAPLNNEDSRNWRRVTFFTADTVDWCEFWEKKKTFNISSRTEQNREKIYIAGSCL